jgi:hypothetical protein
MFKPALGLSIAGLIILSSYSGGAPSAILAASPAGHARVEQLSTRRLNPGYVTLKPQAAELDARPAAAPDNIHITQMITPANKPDVVVAAGIDKANGKAYLAWSADHGEHWTDLSTMLPGNALKGGAPSAQVSSLMEDERGRLLLTMSDADNAKGQVLVLTLGKKMNWLLL